MTTKHFCSYCNALVDVSATEDFCDTCEKKLRNDELEGFDKK